MTKRSAGPAKPVMVNAGDDQDEMAIARRLAAASEGERAVLIAGMPLRVLGEVRDILGFHCPEHGIDLGPYAEDAYAACSEAIDRRDES